MYDLQRRICATWCCGTQSWSLGTVLAFRDRDRVPYLLIPPVNSLPQSWSLAMSMCVLNVPACTKTTVSVEYCCYRCCETPLRWLISILLSSSKKTTIYITEFLKNFNLVLTDHRSARDVHFLAHREVPKSQLWNDSSFRLHCQYVARCHRN